MLKGCRPPDMVVCSPMFFAVFETVRSAPPGIDRRKLKRLIRKAVEREQRKAKA